LALTETSNERSVDGIGLGPQELALSECLNASWIDDAHPFFEAVKVQRERFPICARRLHADVHIHGSPVLKPCHELLKPLRRVREDLLGLAAIAQKTRVKCFFRQIDSQE
jgi:hypothetical protein